jgi:hypothetical protein
VARIRTVKPGFFASADFQPVPLPGRLVMVGLYTMADDEGRLIDSAKKIAGDLFPHDEKVTQLHVGRWLRDLEAAYKILRYEVGGAGARYIQIVNWHKHQRISHPMPSPIPPPSGNDLAAFQNRSGIPPDQICPEGEGELEGELEGEGEKPLGRACSIPSDFTLDEAMREWAAGRVSLVDIDLETQRFTAYWLGTGGKKKSWPQTWRTWMLKEQQDAASRNGHRSQSAVDRAFAAKEAVG